MTKNLNATMWLIFACALIRYELKEPIHWTRFRPLNENPHVSNPPCISQIAYFGNLVPLGGQATTPDCIANQIIAHKSPDRITSRRWRKGLQYPSLCPFEGCRAGGVWGMNPGSAITATCRRMSRVPLLWARSGERRASDSRVALFARCSLTQQPTDCAGSVQQQRSLNVASN
jgi:hypothetical protein